MSVVEKFLKYVSFDTKSAEESGKIPSTDGQLVLAKELVKELGALGMSNISMDEKGFVMAVLPANTDKEIPAIGFMAHMDTSPDISGADIKPRLVENYDGGDIVLNKEQGIILSPKEFPELADYKGKTLITTDGTTLLGADDKAGIAEIMAAVEHLIKHPEILHGKICIAFTPDEEIGENVIGHFDVRGFGADFAYTVDGGAVGELNYENFNAAEAIITVKGRGIHPGRAKNKMRNSILMANEFIGMLPQNETPAHTEGYEGFYHLEKMSGNVEKTVLKYIIRDFDPESFADRKATVESAVKRLNEKYSEGTATVALREEYANMRQMVEPVKHIVDTAIKAMEKAELVPSIVPIRGGTDGARLSYKGLPTPNLFTGGHNYHGKYEFIPTFAMEKAVEVILNIIELYAKA